MEEKLGVFTCVFVDKELQKDVARKYRTSPLVVSKLVS